MHTGYAVVIAQRISHKVSRSLLSALLTNPTSCAQATLYLLAI